MPLVLLFRRLVFAQVLLGVVAFCMAEQNPGMMLIAGTIGALSWYVVEGPAGRPLPQSLIHLGGLVAAGWLIFEIIRWRGATAGDLAEIDIHVGMITAMGHFTMWLQILQLYGRKTNREYALILVLGLMQMIGASVLSMSMIYGMLLASYCVLALFTLLVFQLKSVSDQVLESTRLGADDPDRVSRAELVVGRGHRWQFRLIAILIGLFCAVIGVVVFMMLPRRTDLLLSSLIGTEHGSEVGFTDQVRLGGGPIDASNTEPVLKMALYCDGEPAGDEHLGKLLLRGAALDHYDTKTHTWRRSKRVTGKDKFIKLTYRGTKLGQRQATETLEAEITLLHITKDILFTLYPVTFVESSNIAGIVFNAEDQRLTVDPETPVTSGSVVYRVQRPLERQGQALFDSYHKLNQTTPPNAGMGWFVHRSAILELALKVIADASVQFNSAAPHQDGEEVVRALEHYLQDTSVFTYSLENPTPPGDQDPLASFLLDGRRGHCELFASALAAMWRSLGHGRKARLVTGYRVSEFNGLGGYYVVRQNNAHAWTEIHLPGRGWVKFDPTPPGDLAEEHQPRRGWFSGLRDAYEYMEFQWVSRFVTFDHRTRQRLLSNVNRTVTEAAGDEESWLGAIVQWIRTIPVRWRLDRLNYTVVVIISIFIMVGLVSLARTLVLRHRRLVALQLTTLSRTRRRGLARRLGFYLRMLDMLERHGFQRPLWQSPFDFARQLVREDAHRFGAVLGLTELFYEIRFGHRPLDEPRRNRIRGAMRELESSLAGR